MLFGEDAQRRARRRESWVFDDDVRMPRGDPRALRAGCRPYPCDTHFGADHSILQDLATSRMCSRKGRFSLATSAWNLSGNFINHAERHLSLDLLPGRLYPERISFLWPLPIRTAVLRGGRAPLRSICGDSTAGFRRGNVLIPGTTTSTTSLAFIGKTPAGVAGGNHVARQQGHDARNPGNYNINGEEHCGEGGILFPGAIQQRFNGSMQSGVKFGLQDRAQRTKRCQRPWRASIVCRGPGSRAR